MNAMRLGGGPVPDTPVLTARSPVPILIVDDNSSKRLGLKAILAPLGYLIVEADSGTAALRCVLAQDFAVILLDVCMPLMDGFETAALIRQRHQSETTPIIFITAFKNDELRSTDLYAEGAVDFIFAPVPPEELRAKVSVFAKLFLRAEELASKAREVQGSADQLRLLTDAAPIGIFQTDHHNRYIYTNPRWSEITGIRPEEAVGREWDAIMGSQQRASLTAATPDGAPYRDELCHRFEIRTSEAASARIVLLTSKCVRGQDDGIAGWVGTLADITAEVGAEAAMVDARDEATQASQLFSKVEAGMLEIEDVEFNLRAVVVDVVDLLATQAQAKGLELVAVTDPAVPAAVRGDPGRVRQVLTNLVGNAIKFTSAGEVVVRTGLGDLAGVETVVCFEVSDTGDGIAPDKVDLIFQPFVQADTSTSRRYGGTGLGLAISSHLVSLMGGQCGVTSRLGEGSTFWFTIGVHDPARPEIPSRPLLSAGLAGVDLGAALTRDGPVEFASRTGATGRLLLAEDNPINQKVAVATLSSAGFEVHLVLNGAAAVEAAAAVAYDAILMDCQMPELSGYEATAAIRAREGTGRHTPIIALTAGARREDRERCLAEGMDGYLAKPLNKDALLGLVARFVPRLNWAAPAAPPLAGYAAEMTIDPAVVEELRLLGEGTTQDFFAELVEQFLIDTEPLLAELRQALARGDTATVSRIAHSIKDSSDQLGGRRLAMSCGLLENRATAGHLSDGQNDLQALETDYQELRRSLKQELTAVADVLDSGIVDRMERLGQSEGEG